jgi:peroxiredoxin
MASRISKTTLIIRVTLISAVLALIIAVPSCSSPSPASEAPDFTLPTMTGANITLSELEGTPVALVFWATSCSHCPTELHYFEDVAQQSTGEINVIAIDVGQPISEVERFFGNYTPTMIVALDGSGETFVNYCQNYGNARAYIPFSLFVDNEGLVRYKRIGAFSSEAELWDVLHNVLGITVP